jgi:hypothetical protein
MDTTVIIIQSSGDQNTSIPEKLQDVGKQLTKLMYNSSNTTLNGKSIIVVFPESKQKKAPRVARYEVTTELNEKIIALQNSIKHIVRHGIKHGIDISIQEH